MSILDIFRIKNTEDQQKLHRIYHKINELYPNHSDEEKALVSSLAGLLARVAFTDLNIDEEEKEVMAKSLSKWTSFNSHEVTAIIELASSEIKNLAGLENHIYCQYLRDKLTNEQKYNVLKALFQVAAADGTADNLESEEIRNISKGLLLEHKHFISARATVKESLGVFK
ncbi:MAG: TerB family tellurite resistance protein [Halobacteriovoraceae bacterium]|nr:TerB family tellurite resistance protein [Halobacteriovoraceae bacterium]